MTFPRNPGRPEEPKPLEVGDLVPHISTCPDCKGRGWFLIHPFATGGSNGAGGLSNMTQCQTCKRAHAVFEMTKHLPANIPWPEGIDKTPEQVAFEKDRSSA